MNAMAESKTNNRKLFKLHWRSALLTLLRLRRTGGLVENEVLGALKITLRPPSSPVAASPELTDKIRSYVADDETIDYCKSQHEHILEMNMQTAGNGRWNCMYMLQYYEDVSNRFHGHRGYSVLDFHQLISPRIKRKGHGYRVRIETVFTVEYGPSLPYKMCAISQSRHPDCHQRAPDEVFYTVRVFAVDSFTVRRLSARVPSAYVCALLETAKKATGGEPVDDIIIEQTRYFDLSNIREIEDLLTAFVEDDDKKPVDSDSGSGSDSN